MSIRIEVVADSRGVLQPGEWLAQAETVHRQLRPHLEPEYAAQMQRIFAGGAGMVVAVRDGAVAGLAVFRLRENTFDGQHLYVDDLVTDEAQRSSGIGKALLDWLTQEAQQQGCRRLKLDSGTQRMHAHRFYFREGMAIASFHFFKDISHE